MIKTSNDANDAKKAPAEAVKKSRGRPLKNDPGMVRINVHVLAEEHKKLRIYCAQNSTTITDFIRKTIDDLPV